MEAESEKNDNTTSENDTYWSSTTNWTIVDGALVNSITFESTLSPTIDDDYQNTGDNSTPKPPLILYPPTPDPSPCEITITFAQKHEVQQVYIRSTARVYEIYYAPDLQSSNEYLCTVRCGIATRDEEVLHTPDIGEVALTPQKGDSKELDEKKTKSESSLNTNEDGWVEVKDFDTAQLDNGNSLPSNFSTKIKGCSMDLYEATAEIADADPCMSITLRLLSLQNKGCVFVDEIYVFGDPVEPADSGNRASQTGNPDRSSLMAMFVPTLLQLSKARSAGQVQDDHTLDTKDKQKLLEIGSQATDLTNVANKIQQEENSGLADKQKVKLQETVGPAAIPPQVEMPPRVSDTESKLDLSSCHIEKVLDHLVSRMSRIEDLFLRFEERMLKPINSIEARLQHIEQQLEEVNKKPQNSELQCCTRISAPDFSSNELDDLFDNNENNVPESDEKGSPLCIPPEHVADLANASQSFSSLIVTAPEFSNADDEEEDDELEAVTGSSEDEPKHALSVDDALAYALAGLLSSTAAEPQKFTQALAIKAPDFSFEEDSNSGKKTSPEGKHEIITGPPIFFTVIDERVCINDPVSTSSNFFCSESEMEVMKFDDHHSEKTGEGVDEQYWYNEDGKGDSQDRDIHYTVAPTEQEVAKNNLFQITEDMKDVEVIDGVSNTSVLDECEAVKQCFENQSDDDSGTTQEGAIVNSEFSTTTEVKEEESDKVILQNILEFPCAASIVDFEIPILDVKFVSQDNSDAKSLLEALLGDIPESNVEAPCAMENDDGSQIGQQSNLISVDDYESTSPANGNHFSLDLDYCSLGDMPLNIDDERLHDYYPSNNGEYAARLI